jgi:hypothetical protein
MTVVFLIILFLLGVSIGGYLQKRLTLKALQLENEKTKLSKSNQYLEILSKIKNGESNFKTRVNDTVYVETDMVEFGTVDVIYLMDKNDIAIFQGAKCLHTSDGVSKEIIADIISYIYKIYNKKINDVVNILGFVFYREEFERTFKIKAEDLKKVNLFDPLQPLQQDLNEIDQIKSNNQNRYDIDEILDKISAFGMKVLTPEELAFLDKYSNEKGNKC